MTRSVWLPRLAGLALLLAFALACVFVPGIRQSTPPDDLKDEATAPPDDLKFVPADCGVFVTVRVADVMGSEAGEKILLALRQEYAAQFDFWETSYGLSLDDVERLTLVGSPDPEHDTFGSWIIRTVEPYDRAEVVGPKAETLKVEGKRVYRRGKNDERGGSDALVYPVNKNTLVISPKTRLVAMLKAAEDKKEHPLAVGLQRASRHQIVAALQPEPVVRGAMRRKEFKERREEEMRRRESQRRRGEEKDKGKEEKRNDNERRREQNEEEKKEPKREKQPDYEDLLDELTLERESRGFHIPPAPPFLLTHRPLFHAKWVVLTADAGKQFTAALEAEFADADAAKDGEVAVRSALYAVRTQVQRMVKQPRSDRRVDLLSLEKPIVAALKAAKVQREGTKVTASASAEIDVLASLARAIQEAATRTRAVDHFQQIGLAMHGYHDANGRLPAATICDDKGKPLLSWRVTILPYLGQVELYKQFKLDEPWDSKHNKPLLDKMPSIYAPTVGKTKVPHATYYRVFTGENALFQTGTNVGPNFTSITDGTTYTIMAVEAAEEVPWTKPDELTYGPKRTLPRLGAQFPGKFLVLMTDGSVKLANVEAREMDLRKAIDPADGQPPDEWWK